MSSCNAHRHTTSDETQNKLIIFTIMNEKTEHEARLESINKPVRYGEYLLLNGSAIIKFNGKGIDTLGFPPC